MSINPPVRKMSGPESLGSEFTVNQETSGEQNSVSSAVLNNGTYVTVWASRDSDVDGDGYGIAGQLFAADGSRIGDEFAVSTGATATGDAYFPDVTATPNGGFFVVWASPDEDNYGVFGRAYNASGTAQGGIVTINEDPAGRQYFPGVDVLENGNLIAVWHSTANAWGDGHYGITGRLLSQSGSMLGDEFQISENTGVDQYGASVEASPDGGFSVIWSMANDPSVERVEILGRSFDEDGTPINDGFQVAEQGDTRTFARHEQTVLENGNIVIAWERQDADTEAYDVRVEIRDAAGNVVTPAFDAGDDDYFNAAPAIAALPQGGFMLVYYTGDAFHGQYFDNSGNEVGDSFVVVDDYNPGWFFPSIALQSDQEFLVTWGTSASEVSVSGAEIRGRLFGEAPVASVAGQTISVADVQRDDSTLRLDYAHAVTGFEVGGNSFVAVTASESMTTIFRVSADGSLTYADEIHINETLDTRVVEVDGKTFLVAADTDERGLFAYEISSSGTASYRSEVSDVNQEAALVGAGTGLASAVVGGETYFFSTRPYVNAITSFRLDGDGTLTQVDYENDFGSVQTIDSNQLETAQIGGKTFVYATHATTNTVYTYEVGTGGELRQIGSLTDSGALSMATPADLEVIAYGGKLYLYVASFGENAISVFSIGADGGLTYRSSYEDDGAAALDKAISITSGIIGGATYLIVSGRADEGVSFFKIGTNGGLTHEASVYDDDTTALENPFQIALVEAGGTAFLATTSFTEDGGLTLFDLGQGYTPTSNGDGTPSSGTEFPDDTLPGGDFAITDGDDLLEGTDAGDKIEASGGADTISGAGGNDNLGGQDGNDLIDGGAGGDTLRGNAGDDTLSGGAGNDQIWAGAGDEGRDSMDGGAGNDTIGGGAGDDTLKGGAGADILFGGSGDDELRGNGESEPETTANQIWAGDGNDKVFGDAGNDVMGGGEGNDEISGGAGNDLIFAGRSGDDTIGAGAGNDLAYGGSGSDDVSGGNGIDELYGGAGDDYVEGGAGDDSLYGGAGGDIIDGGTGDDNLRGGDGADLFLFRAGAGQDTVYDFSISADSLQLADVAANFTDEEDVGAAATQTDEGVLIDLGGGDSLLLVGLDINDLSGVTFVF